jgi:hypothetical protein
MLNEHYGANEVQFSCSMFNEEGWACDLHKGCCSFDDEK